MAALAGRAGARAGTDAGDGGGRVGEGRRVRRHVHPRRPDRATTRPGGAPVTDLDDAVAALRAGEVIILPTDTVYGVGALPAASARLFEVKERPADVALPVLAADVEQALGLADGLSPAAVALAERFWPGGLTLVVRRRPGLEWD